jgi:hypothetical protein
MAAVAPSYPTPLAWRRRIEAALGITGTPAAE